MPDTTTLTCSCHKLGSFLRHCYACGRSGAEATAAPPAAELTPAERRALEDFVPAAAGALWSFVAACEELVEVTSIPGGDCATCAGGGCERCGGLGFKVDARLSRALQAALAAAVALCTDDGHPVGCTCGGDLIPAGELVTAAVA